MDDYYSYKRGLDDGRNEILKVIEDIKAEIEANKNWFKAQEESGKDYYYKAQMQYRKETCEMVFEIINRKVSEVKHDCTACKHSDEEDGSNCYECVKGITDNFEVNEVTDDQTRSN